MIQSQVKLKLNRIQEALLEAWLWNLTGVWNWAIRKIELNAKNKIYFSKRDFQNMLANHGNRLGIPSHVLQGVLAQAHLAWNRCFKKKAKAPRLKGRRNKMSSVPFPDPLNTPKDYRVAVPVLGKVKYHKQAIPAGKIKCGRIVKRASGWYLCLFIDTERKPIKRVANGKIGIDPGFKHLIVTSDGVKIEHPRELEASAKRLAQAQRGGDTVLAARLQEHIANQKKDRNHKLSLKLVEENTFIAFSKDNINGIATKFGKSVTSSAHYQLREMIEYKSRTGGTQYVEVGSKNSTKTCSECGSLTGPTGWDGLAVRQWVCEACGAEHDRDINAARNTLIAGAGLAHEMPVVGSLESSGGAR